MTSGSHTTDADLWPLIRRDGTRWHVDAGQRHFGVRRTPWTAKWLVVKAKRILAGELRG
jgi:hypothetical protein